MKTVIKVCRKCGRPATTKRGSYRAKTCICGGKLVVNLEASHKAIWEMRRKQREEIVSEIQKIDDTMKSIENMVMEEPKQEK